MRSIPILSGTQKFSDPILGALSFHMITGQNLWRWLQQKVKFLPWESEDGKVEKKKDSNICDDPPEDKGQ